MARRRIRRRPTTRGGGPKRRFPRLNTDGTAVGVRQGFGTTGADDFLEASLINLSPTGACVELSGSHRFDAEANLTLNLNLQGFDLELPAQVAWIEDTAAGQRFGVALHLERAAAGSRTHYARWIVTELQKQHQRQPNA